MGFDIAAERERRKKQQEKKAQEAKAAAEKERKKQEKRARKIAKQEAFDKEIEESLKAAQKKDEEKRKKQEKLLTCKHCGEKMEKTKKAEKNLGLQSLGCGLFIVGIMLLFFFPFGTIAGFLIIVGSARLGYNIRKVWYCKNCDVYLERG